MAASPLLCRGPKRGRKCYVTPVLSGVPNAERRAEISSGCLTLIYSEAQKKAEMVRHPYIVRGAERQA